MKPLVSIVIANCNGYNELTKCLDSIKQIDYPRIDTIVFDNGSSGNDCEKIKRNYRHLVRLISFKKNYGFAIGYNRVLKKLRSKYVFIINNDTVLTPSLIGQLTDYAEKHPNTAIIQPKILSLKNPQYFEYAGACGGYVDKLGYPYCRGRVVFHVEKDNGQYDTIADIFWASGTAMFCRLKVIKQVGLFDEDLVAYVEEHDLCWRVLKAGYRIVSLPKAKIYHKGSAYWKHHLPKKTYLIHRNNLLVHIKNSTIRRLLTILPLRILLDYLAILYYIARGYPSFTFSVLKAHFSVIRLFPKFWKKRLKGNYQQDRYIETNLMHPRSIIFEYFVKGKKCYSQLTTQQ